MKKLNSRNVRIFVSSTFRDMDFERDLLRTIVSQRLNDYFSPSGINVEFVDLRYGVNTSSETDRHERDLQIFNFCMNEIGDCSPFFIALIGHRYGWIPEMMTQGQFEEIAALREEDLPIATDKLSITVMECLYGPLGKGHEKDGALLYLRKPDSYENLSEAEKADFIDSGNGARLSETFRSYIIDKAKESGDAIKIQEYTLHQDRHFSDESAEWCEQVFNNVRDMISERLVDDLTAQSVASDDFVLMQNRYMTELAGKFVGREELISKCCEKIDRIRQCRVVSQMPGLGLSSTVAKLCQLYGDRPDAIALYASDEVGSEVTIKQIFQGFGRMICYRLGLEVPGEFTDTGIHSSNLRPVFCAILKRAQQSGLTAVFALDGDFEYESGFNLLEFICEDSSYRQRRIYIEGYCYPNDSDLKLRQEYSDYVDVEVGPLDERTKILLTSSLPQSVAKRLRQRWESGMTIWMSIAVHILENLGRSQMMAMRSRGDEGAMASYLEMIVEKMPSDPADLIDQWNGQLADIFGEKTVRAIGCAMTICPLGLSERGMSLIAEIPEATVAAYRSALGNETKYMSSGVYQLANDFIGKDYDEDVEKMLCETAKRAAVYLQSQAALSGERISLLSAYLFSSDYRATAKELCETQEVRSINARDTGLLMHVFALTQPRQLKTIFRRILAEADRVGSINMLHWVKLLYDSKLQELAHELIEIFKEEADKRIDFDDVLEAIYYREYLMAENKEAKLEIIDRGLALTQGKLTAHCHLRNRFLRFVNLCNFSPSTNTTAPLDNYNTYYHTLRDARLLGVRAGEENNEYAVFSFYRARLLQYYGRMNEAIDSLFESLAAGEYVVKERLTTDYSNDDIWQAIDNLGRTISEGEIMMRSQSFKPVLVKRFAGVCERYAGYIEEYLNRTVYFGQFLRLHYFNALTIAAVLSDVSLDEKLVRLEILLDRASWTEEEILAGVKKCIITSGIYTGEESWINFTEHTVAKLCVLSSMMLVIAFEDDYNFSHNQTFNSCGERFFKILNNSKTEDIPRVLDVNLYLRNVYLAGLLYFHDDDDWNNLCDVLKQMIEFGYRCVYENLVLDISGGSVGDSDYYDECIADEDCQSVVEHFQSIGWPVLSDYYYYGLALMRLGEVVEAMNVYKMLSDLAPLMPQGARLSVITNLLFAALAARNYELFDNTLQLLSAEDREDDDIIELCNHRRAGTLPETLGYEL